MRRYVGVTDIPVCSAVQCTVSRMRACADMCDGVCVCVVHTQLPPSFLLDRDLNEADLGYKVIDAAQRLLEQDNATEKLLNVFIDPVPTTRFPRTSNHDDDALYAAPAPAGDRHAPLMDRSSSTPMDAAEQHDAAARYSSGDAVQAQTLQSGTA